MAQDITLWGANYQSVPAILLPKTGGGTATFYDENGTLSITANGTQSVQGYANVEVNVSGGSLPTGFSKIAKGQHTLAADTNGAWTLTHNLGATPDILLVYRDGGNVAQTYSILWCLYSTALAYRSSSYKQYCGYHGNSKTTVSTGNDTSRPVTAINSTTASMSYYSSTSHYWRAGTYNWVAIKFS